MENRHFAIAGLSAFCCTSFFSFLASWNINKDSGSCLNADVPDTKMTSEIFSDRWASVTCSDHLQIWTCAASDNKIKNLT